MVIIIIGILNPNGISIGLAIFARLTTVTDRQTDHATRSVTIGRIYVRSTAMRSNNTNVNVYGAVIMNIAIAGVLSVHLTNTWTDHQMAANPQTKPPDLACESVLRLLPSIFTIAIYYYCLCRKLIGLLVLPSHGRWNAEST